MVVFAVLVGLDLLDGRQRRTLAMLSWFQERVQLVHRLGNQVIITYKVAWIVSVELYTITHGQSKAH